MSLPVAPPDRLEAGPFVLRAMVEDDWAVEVALARDADVLRWTHYRYFALLPSGRRRGAATRAAQTLGDWVLENGTDVVSLVIFEGNDASEAVARRAGFSLRRRASTEHHGLPTETAVWERMAQPAGGPRLRGGS